MTTCIECGDPIREPKPGMCGPCSAHDRLAELCVLMRRERDEARAEVERLQKRLGDKAELLSKQLADAFTEGTLAAGDAIRDRLRTEAERQREADTRNVCGDTCQRAALGAK